MSLGYINPLAAADFASVCDFTDNFAILNLLYFQYDASIIDENRRAGFYLGRKVFICDGAACLISSYLF